jgi:hypothetical protein
MDIHGSDIRRNRHISNINIDRRMDSIFCEMKASPYPLNIRGYRQKALFTIKIYIPPPKAPVLNGM